MRSLFDIASGIAARQEGRVTRAQLLAAGIDTHRIRRWVADGRLYRVHRGVYSIGRPVQSMRGEYMAAVLACGLGAVLSHWAAAILLGIVKLRRVPRPEVTVPTTAARARPGIKIHRVATLHPLDTMWVGRIRVTSVARTLLDLAPTMSLAQLTRACHEAWIRHDAAPAEVIACIERNPGKPGARRLRLALGTDVTLSELEDGFLALLREHGLPLPRTNIDHAGDKVDCHWPDVGLTVELVSFRFHETRCAFEEDVARRRRSNHLAFSYGDVFQRGEATARELAARLHVEY
jgi:predicted transcriptional regulator of viral defense system